MSQKMILAPTISEAGIPGFLLWARREQRDLYTALRQEFPAVNEFERQLGVEDGLQGFADVLRNVGSTLASSAKSIGSFVAKNALPIASVAVPLLVAKKQSDVAKAQVKLAIAQQAPMQTAYATDAQGNVYSVGVRQTLSAAGMEDAPIQQMNLTAQKIANFGWKTPIVAGIPLWGVAAGLGALGLVVMLKRR